MNNTARFILINLLFLLNACSDITDNIIPVSKADSFQAVTMRFEGDIDRFGVKTRATTSSWDDGATVYIQFTNSNVSGYATYDKAENQWTLYYKGQLTQNQKSSCEVYYFEKPMPISSSFVLLSHESALYVDKQAVYMYSDGSVTLRGHLEPMTGRVRFRGKTNQKFTLLGLKYNAGYDQNTNTISYSNKAIEITIGDDGFTPYIYASLDDENTRELTIVSDENKYKKTVSPQVLTIGKSGYIDIPSSTSNNGWEVIDGDYISDLVAWYQFTYITMPNKVNGEQRPQMKTTGSGTVPTTVLDTERESNVLRQSCGSAENLSYTLMENPLKGLTSLRGMTIAMWVKANDNDLWNTLWSFTEAEANGAGARFFMTRNTYTGFNNNSGTWFDINHPNSGATNYLPTGSWAFLTVVLNAAGITIYVDGERKAQKAFAGSEAFSQVLSFLRSAEYMQLGAGSFWGSADCSIDDLFVYKRALTAYDVKSLFDIACQHDMDYYTLFCPDSNHPHAIDLGLGVKFACCNVGADSPTGYGNYYAWGETSTKSEYNWSTYKWCNGSQDSMTKYCTSSSYGTVDNKTTLEFSDDAAWANWGNSWRMPTFAELNKLYTDCTWTWATINNINGYRVTGSNGNSIFLPAAGYRLDTSLLSVGSYGYYWSSSLNTGFSYYALNLYFDSSDRSMSSGSRCGGLSVRPVTE